MNENLDVKKTRNVHIDLMKGIGIMLVVFAHTYSDSGAIYLFHMPLFFMLSGAVLVYAKHGYSLSRRFKGIMVPYFIFSLLWFAYWWLIESRLRPMHDAPLFPGALGTLNVKVQQFVNIFVATSSGEAFMYNVVLWFLPCLFVADWLYAILRKRKHSWVYVTVSAILYYVAFAKLPALPWCLNLAVLSVSLLFIGHKTYGWLYQTASMCGTALNSVIVVVLTAVFVAIALTCDLRVDMRCGIVPPFYSFYGMAMLGSLIVFTVALVLEKARMVGGGRPRTPYRNSENLQSESIAEVSCLSQGKKGPFEGLQNSSTGMDAYKLKVEKSEIGVLGHAGGVITYFGRNSLIVMCIHEPIKRVLLVVLSKVTAIPVETLRGDVCLSILCTVLLMTVCVPFIWGINKRLPWMIGKF